MREDVDIVRVYAEALLRQWQWILGAGILSALLTFGAAMLQTPSYQSTALVVLAEPSQLLQFDPRIRTVDNNQPLVLAYPEIALSDEVLENLVVQLASDEISTVELMRGKLKADLSDDPRLLRLTAHDSDAVESAAIANSWAELFVNWVNESYSTQGDSQLRFFEDQLQESLAELERAEQSKIEFQARNGSASVASELERLKGLQSRYLDKKQNILFLMQDVQALQDQLTSRAGNKPVTLADQLTAMFLQLQAFNAGTSAPLQIQFDSAEGFTVQSKQEQILLLADLNTTLASRLTQIEEEVLPLEQQILTLQRKQQEIGTENERVSRDKTIAEETYMTLARKVEEERITSQDKSSGVLLASQAAVPTGSSSPVPLLKAIIAGIVGFLLASVVVLVLFWWKQNAETGAAIPSNDV